MPRFFTAEVNGDKIITTGEDARHIGYSLRMKIGDEITFCSGGFEYFCKIEEMNGSEVVSGIVEKRPTESEPSVFLTLYQAYPKSDKLELIVQKATELGVSRIVPFTSKRCVAKPPTDKSGAKRTERLRKIAMEAAKQSGRGIIPEVTEPMTFREAVEDMKRSDIRLFCYENGGIRLNDSGIDSEKSVALMVGSEGGFDRDEAELAEQSGAQLIWLGKRILRCETCPIAVSAVVMNLSGNL